MALSSFVKWWCCALTLLSLVSSNPEPSILNSSATSVATPQKRWVSQLYDYRGAEPWPRTPGKNYVYIRYCFPTKQVRDEAKCFFERSLDLWGTALGGFPSDRSGHAVVVKEAKNVDKQYKLCYNGAGSGVDAWTYDLSEDALVVMLEDGEGDDEATTGYQREGGPGRHFLKIGRRTLADDQVYRVAHEFGHVLGMGHEHQRKDRDSFIGYMCEALDDYPDAYSKAKADNPTMQDNEIQTKLCDDWAFSNKYHFTSSRAFHLETTSDTSDEFDWDSIMLYDSDQGGSGCARDIENCPMLKGVRNPSTGQVAWTRFQGGRTPSKGDVDFVRRWYPFYPPSEGIPPDVPPKPPSLQQPPKTGPPPLPHRPPAANVGI